MIRNKSEQQIIKDFYYILLMEKLDETFIRQFSSFFTNIQWKLIVKNQDMSDNFIRQFNNKFVKLYNCQDFRALKKKIDSIRLRGKIENNTDD